MKVLVVFPDMRSGPVGIFWLDEDEPDEMDSHFAEVTPAEVVARMTLQSKVPTVSYAAFFDQLSERTPRPVNYETYDIGEHPVSYLNRLRRIASR